MAVMQEKALEFSNVMGVPDFKVTSEDLTGFQGGEAPKTSLSPPSTTII
jgi:hypothetical protein